MEIGLLLILFLANGLFAMSEIAVVTARKSRLQQRADEGDTRARAALELAEHPTQFLSTVQIGITSIGILTGIVGEGALAQPLAEFIRRYIPALEQAASGIALTVVVIVITFLSIIIGELVPKRVGQMHAEAIAGLIAAPMRVLSWIATPFVRLLSMATDSVLKLIGAKETKDQLVTEEEIQVLMAQGATAGIFEQAEQQMVRNVFRLDERRLSSLMVPRSDIVYLDVNDPLEVSKAKIESSHYSRFPVVRDDLSDVIGFVRAKDLLAQLMAGEPLDLTARLTPVLYVPETLTGTELVQNFRDSHTQTALVVDEYGDVQGLVTLRDVLEAIVGEFHTSTSPEEPSAVKREDGSWLLDGLLDVHELEDMLDLPNLPEGDSGTYHTLSGMLMLLLGRIPQTGEQVDWGGWNFEIVDMDGKRIDKVIATRIPQAESENEAY
ncbi:hemolysin family protein [Pigmentiphaga sp.]|nr:hemolysin family protein [Pigmentiphaga sp.]MBX6317886.1 HlyC/CorC family transporter [Pigmentiphaga sp.]